MRESEVDVTGEPAGDEVRSLNTLSTIVDATGCDTNGGRLVMLPAVVISIAAIEAVIRDAPAAAAAETTPIEMSVTESAVATDVGKVGLAPAHPREQTAQAG